jgi:nucleotide-binding universal stress UspA family protein
MFQHILVPVDYTQKNRSALKLAIHLATPGPSMVSVLHVIELIADTPVEEFDSFYASLEEQALQKMKELVAAYSDTPVQITHHIAYGSRTQEIVRFAQEQAADLIVMNSHKLDWNEPAQGWGTISYKVSILAACPVLLVK